ncbi:hypothetical protein H310_03897 [Aphanomyces invadans]|uniref:Spermatogenesis-associated protein 4 n=1 Tax=Aphanomyces invadans TaxID=157072 RepID=A0A024UEV6_9STRA|nr:hypothetical protein H310_03897 [Aphanomyces invadans]ETW04750.1 hypothetical protein H310_03897 [Aphanomyces invadans]|eukprot:XP_008866188.1 hypothetical protein H310_03897 [Aphanomyces invadans]
MSNGTTVGGTTAASSLVATASNKLNRELLRWLQSLDLAYSLKNIKRDFSNGFLIAEIMSRYYDKDISMHSFDNGIGLKVKKDNWDQLLKFMQKIPEFDPLGGKPAADAVMHCENGAAVTYLGRLYQCLTKRELQTVQPRPVEEDIPPYAKPTGSTLIREKMRGPEFVETLDELQIGQKARTVNARHEESLQLERLAESGPTSLEPAKMVRPRKQKLVGEESPICTHAVVKEVQIKTIDDKNFNLAQLRAMRDANASMLQSGQAEYGYGIDQLDLDGAPEKGSVKRRVMDLLNEYISRKLTGTPVLSQLDGRKDRFEGFLEAMWAGGVLHDQDAAGVLEHVVDPGGVLAGALMDSPKDFAKFAGMLHPCLNDYGDDNPIFLATVHMHTTLGAQAVKRDANAAAMLLSDFALPRLASLITTWPSKRHALLKIVYSFSAPKLVAHIQVIKRLREALPRMDVFIDCISLLLGLETELDETLADLYYYYCCMGLDMPHEKLRAACLSMLPRFLAWQPSLTLDLIARVSEFSTRYAWWEVKAQLIIVASAVLTHLTSQPPCDQLDCALTILQREVTPRAPVNLRRVGIAYMAKLLWHFQELVPTYVDVLRSLPLHMLQEVVSIPNEPFVGTLPLQGGSGAIYQLPVVRNVWDSSAIAKQVYLDFNDTASDEGAHDHHHPQSMTILQVCFDQIARDQPPEHVNELFAWTQSMVVAGLEHDHSCEMGVAILSTVAFYSSPSINVLDGPTMDQTLTRICSSGREAHVRLNILAQFLHQLYVSNHASAVKVALNKLKSSVRSFHDSPFAAAVHDLLEG